MESESDEAPRVNETVKVPYRRLGKSGLVVSALGLGNYLNANHFSDEEAYAIYVRAFEAGVVRQCAEVS